MPKGTPLHKILTKDEFLKLYQINGSIHAVSKYTGFDPSALRNFMKKNDIEFKYKTIYKHNDNAFEYDNEQSAYWAGFIAADGCIKEKNKNTKILSVALANKDKDHLLKLKNFLLAEEPIHEFDKYSSLNIVSNKIAKDLEKYNIVPRKTHIYKFPNINEKLYSNFMRGYFDGDGGLSLISDFKRNKTIPQIRISLRGTYQFLEQFRKILVQKTNVNEAKISLSNGIYIFQYGGNNNGRKILQYLYKDTNLYLDRKYNIAQNYLQ